MEFVSLKGVVIEMFRVNEALFLEFLKGLIEIILLLSYKGLGMLLN